MALRTLGGGAPTLVASSGGGCSHPVRMWLGRGTATTPEGPCWRAGRVCVGLGWPELLARACACLA